MRSTLYAQSRAGPPSASMHPHRTSYTVLTGPPDYLGTNHAPGSPPATHVRDLRLSVITALGVDFKGRRCLDIGCNDGTVSTQIGEGPLSVPRTDYTWTLLIPYRQKPLTSKRATW